MTTLDQCIRRLPVDIIQHIRRYTYSHQPIALQEDIRNFLESRRELYVLYYNYWSIHWGQDVVREFLFWMVNDIVIYIHTTVEKYLEIISRAYIFDKSGNRIRTHYQLDAYRRALNAEPVETQFNIYWGLLTPSERTDVSKNIRDNTQIYPELVERYLFLLSLQGDNIQFIL